MNNSESKKSVIIGAQLQKARKFLQLELQEVAREINVNPTDIIKWENEQSRPSLKQLEALAKLYGRGIDYFLRETPAPPEKIEFRGKPGQSLKGLPKEAKIALSRFDELCQTALEFENLLNKKREIKLPTFKESDSPRRAAQILREKFNVGNKPLSNLRDRLEDEGARIFELPVPENTFSGFSFWHQDYGPCILLNANEQKGRKNFTLAHELFHLLYKHESGLCYIPERLGKIRGGIEYKANQFAIELLLPDSGVMEDFKRRNLSREPSEKELAEMAYYKWNVSIQALGYRLEKLGLIESGHTDTLFELKPQYFRGKKGRRFPKWKKQLGKQFVETSFEAYQRGLISIGKFAQALGTTVREALEEIERRSK